MDILESKHCALIIEKAQCLLDVLEYHPDIDLISAFIKKHRELANQYNTDNYDMCDPTKDEIKQYKIVRSRWIKDQFNFIDNLSILINQMSLNLDSFKMYILLLRKQKKSFKWHESNQERSAKWKLHDTLRETVKNTIIKEFTEIYDIH